MHAFWLGFEMTLGGAAALAVIIAAPFAIAIGFGVAQAILIDLRRRRT